VATSYQLKPFRFNLDDLNFMLDQIKFKPLFDSNGNAIVNWDGHGDIYNSSNLATRVQYNTTGMSAADAILAFGTSYTSVTASQGLRDVTGLDNNLLLVNSHWGAADQPFMVRMQASFDNYVQALHSTDADAFYATKFSTANTTLINNGSTDYTKTASHAGANVVDYTPRMISQLTTTAGATFVLQNGHTTKDVNGFTAVADYGMLETSGHQDKQNLDNNEFYIGSVNPGVAPGNGWLAMFGQFFDHGLDFIGKGGDGTKITIPLALDDPMYGVIGPDGRPTTSITISRANVSGFDAAGNAQWINHTSPYIDQSQTYGSSAQITNLLREWVSTDGGVTFHAGAELLDGTTSVSWKNGFGETTNATLPTLNELRAHLVATGRDDLSWSDVVDGFRNRDANGDVATGTGAGNSGQALLLDLNPRFDTGHLSTATQAALHAMGIDPVGGSYSLGGPGSLGAIIDFRTFAPKAGFETLGSAVLLESVGDHYIAGDGRVNENIALTTIHHVFHEEHNYQVRNIENAILAQDARAVELGDSSHSVAHQWQVVTGTQDANGNYLDSAGKIAWDGPRIFDAAKLTVEMEYQHTAVDQYARTITPDLPEFVGYNSGENATVSIDYAQVGFRFGHSTIRESIDLIDPAGGITGKVMSIALEQAFLNPALYAQKGAAAIALGMTHQQMNEIDEFITPALNQGLLGQPLDLAAINIARGRDVGIPTLNEFRVAIGFAAYTSWSDFGQNMIHPDNLVNFIAAYSFDGNLAKAQAIIGLNDGSITTGDPEALGYTADDAYAFLSGSDNGYTRIDTWLGGLAEAHVSGGLLGETFNAIFVDQINRLMDGDRFYYLYRLNNLNMGDEIANAQFKDIIERNTGLEHLNGSAFAYADQYYDLSQNATSAATFKTEHKYGAQLTANPTLGIYSDGGASTNSNGSIITVGGVSYIKDVRPLITPTAANHLSGAGGNLDGTDDSGANSNEVMVATDNRDLIYARGGDDTIYGEGGNDTIYGGGGIDRLYGGDGNDEIHGEDGGDLIDGGAGDDKLYGESSQSSAAGVDQIIGSGGNDTIYGGIGIDKLSGGSGDDVIFGGQDTDAFTHGGDGNDYLDGGTDGDILWGDGGSDLIVGGNNQDILAGLDGDDILRPGNLSSASGGGPDEVLGGDGTGDLGQDGVGIGFDMIDFSDVIASVNGMNADFSTQANPIGAINPNATFPAWVGIEGFIGSQNNDIALADGENNWLIGGSGNDTLTGGGGNDVIVGDGIRLDSLIGTYAGAYNHVFDEATHRVTGFIQNNGLLGNSTIGTAGFQKHYTEMIKSDIFKNLELGGSAITTLNGVADTRVGDGGIKGTADTVVFRGARANYTVTQINFATQNEGTVLAFKITDNRPGSPDGTDIVVGVENFKFSDGTITLSQLLAQPPVITSDGGGSNAAIAIAENTTAITTVTATDINAGDVLIYTITGGADAALFTLNATTGVLTLNTAANFEAPADAGANNVYDVVVQVSDGTYNDVQTLAVTVQNVNEAATGALAIDPITGYTITNNVVSITASNTLADPDGMINFVQYQWQNFVGGNWVNIPGATTNTVANTANAPVRVLSSYTDAFGIHTFTAVADQLKLAPVIISNLGGATATTNVAENSSVVTTVTATDANLGDVLTYSIDGGADAGKFTIDANTGALSFIAAPNFESATDAGANNVYDVIVKVSDGSLFDTQAIAVTVTNLNEAATGSLNITGYTATDTNANLTALNTLSDPDGMTGFVQYQWQRLNTNTGLWQNIAGATSATLANQSNASVRVTSTYTQSTFGLTTVVAAETAIIGTNGDNYRAGTAGVDYVLGLAGNDNLTGNAGNDTVDGGIGNDTMNATANDGNDVYIGGAGIDTYDLSATAAAATVNLTTGTASSAQTGTDILTGFEDVSGSSGNDNITDGAGVNRLDGNNGNDTFAMTNDGVADDVRGGGNNDTIDYSALIADLSVILNGNSAVTVTNGDTIRSIENFIGGSGNDTITGDNNANQLTGGAGNDVITGGTGADVLTGGSGTDTFIYTATNQSGIGAALRDLITDFAAGDKLNFAGIDANTTNAAPGDQAFVFNALAGAAITGAGQLVYHYEGSGANEITVIQGNINNNLAPDFEIALTGHVVFNAATDIIL
jgi:Ca2+-binding RTX toxin-like protein